MTNSPVPLAGSRRYRLMIALKEHGSMNAEALMKYDSNWHGFESVARCKKELDQMIKRGALVELDGLYSLSPSAIAHFDGSDDSEPKIEVPVVLPQYRPEFRPMTCYGATLRAKLDTPPRSHYSGSAAPEPKLRGVAI